MDGIDNELMGSDGHASAGLMALARDLADADPLHPAPYFIAAQVAFQEGRIEEGYEYLELGSSRNPRFAPAHKWLAVRDSSIHAYDQALARLVTAFRLDKAGRREIVESMVEMAGQTEGRTALERQIEHGPHNVSRAILYNLNRQLDDVEYLVRLNRTLPDLQDMLVSRVLAEEGVLSAYSVWRALLQNDLETEEIPYDPGFDALPGAPPFNWQLTEGASRYNAGGGVYVSYHGQRPESLLQQVVLLPPGAYGVQVTARVDAHPRGSELHMQVQCETQDDLLMDLALTRSEAGFGEYQSTFQVPDKCAAQYLVLKGFSSDLSTWARADIRHIRIVRQDD